MSTVIDFTAAKSNCPTCHQAKICLAQGLNEQEIQQFSDAVTRQRVVRRGDVLFRQGDTLDILYFIRSGSVKIYSLSDEGDEQVLGFYFPGDLLGLDASDSGYHDCTAVALETSGLCE